MIDRIKDRKDIDRYKGDFFTWRQQLFILYAFQRLIYLTLISLDKMFNYSIALNIVLFIGLVSMCFFLTFFSCISCIFSVSYGLSHFPCPIGSYKKWKMERGNKSVSKRYLSSKNSIDALKPNSFNPLIFNKLLLEKHLSALLLIHMFIHMYIFKVLIIIMIIKSAPIRARTENVQGVP